MEIKRNNCTRSYREKFNMAIAILQKSFWDTNNIFADCISNFSWCKNNSTKKNIRYSFEFKDEFVKVVSISCEHFYYTDF